MADPLDQPVSRLTKRPVISSTDILLGVTNPSLAPTSVGIPVSAFDNRYQQVFNPVNYGAKGDNSTDDTSAVQETVDAAHASTVGGAFIFLPSFFKITKALRLYSDIAIKGVGMEISGIRQSAGGEDALYGLDCSSLIMEDFSILGNGVGSSPGSNNCGINLDWSTTGNNPFHNFRNILLRNHGSDGIRAKTPIVCGFDKVYTAYNGNHGFNWYQGGTSCNFRNTWARQNAGAGYRFNESVYQALNGCAADNNGTGYLVQNAQSIGFNACGAEGQLKNDATYNGYGWKIDNSSVITINPGWITDNRNLGIWVTGGSQAVDILAADNTPNASAQYFIQTDVGTNTTIRNLHNTSPNKLDGNVVILNDGAAGMRVDGALYMQDSQFIWSNGHIMIGGAGGNTQLRPASNNGLIQFQSFDGTDRLQLYDNGMMLLPSFATASAPVYVKGGMYFDTTLNKLRVGGATGWETVTSV